MSESKKEPQILCLNPISIGGRRLMNLAFQNLWTTYNTVTTAGDMIKYKYYSNFKHEQEMNIKCKSCSFQRANKNFFDNKKDLEF